MSFFSRLFRRGTRDGGRGPSAPTPTPTPGPAPTTAAPAVAPVPTRTPDPAAVEAGLGSNSEAKAALSALTGSTEYGGVDGNKQVSLLDTFAATPNSATATWARGEAGVTKGGSEEEVAAARDLMTPDSGKVVLGGVAYTIAEGRLLDKDGKDVGGIDNLGRWTIGETSGDVYADLHAEAELKEGEDTLLSLHDADPNGRLASESMHPEFAARAGGMLGSLRREGLDMGVASGFRSVKSQNALYAQGRTAPGSVVTNARGGHSWHNYGTAADMAFNKDDGGLSWSGRENWDRYGEVAEKSGLEWGGAWKGQEDLPHVEYHPGLDASEAWTLLDDYRAGGLDDAWKEIEEPAAAPLSFRDKGTKTA
jgi:hypothetical protein